MNIKVNIQHSLNFITQRKFMHFNMILTVITIPYSIKPVREMIF